MSAGGGAHQATISLPTLPAHCRVFSQAFHFSDGEISGLDSNWFQKTHVVWGTELQVFEIPESEAAAGYWCVLLQMLSQLRTRQSTTSCPQIELIH